MGEGECGAECNVMDACRGEGVVDHKGHEW